MNPGGHIAHFIHWLHAESELGGPLALAGMAVGAVIGYISNPLMQPTDLCRDHGIGKNAFGQCPDVFSFEALATILGIAVVFGALGAAIGWIAEQGKSSS